MKKSKTIESYIFQLPLNRQLLAHKLLELNWFKKSDFRIKKQILDLPDSFEGYIFDLSKREDRFGANTIIALKKISIGEHLVITVFETKSKTNSKPTLKEYVSWKLGKHPGIKGLILVKSNGKITHFITTRAEKFPVGYTTFDSVGGLTQYSAHQITDSLKEISSSIKNKLGLDKINISEIHDLGRLEVDNGLTPNHPGIFAATIEAEEFPNVNLSNSKIDVVPIGQLDQYISKIDDSFFLAIISRLLAKKIITL